MQQEINEKINYYPNPKTEAEKMAKFFLQKATKISLNFAFVNRKSPHKPLRALLMRPFKRIIQKHINCHQINHQKRQQFGHNHPEI